MPETPLVETRCLTRTFDPPPSIFPGMQEPVRAIEDINLGIYPAEILGVIGEPGSGKSTLGRLLIRLLQPTSGQVFFEGQDIQTLNRDGQQRLRRQSQIVFQHPHSAFDPHYTIYKSLV